LRTFADLHRAVDLLDLSERRARKERERVEQWFAVTEERVFSALGAEARARASELEKATEAIIRVSTSGTAGQPGAPRAPVQQPRDFRIRAVSLELGSSRVDVYSMRGAGEAVRLHFGVSRGATGIVRFPVMASFPGCLVVRNEDGGFELLLPVCQPPGGVPGDAPERRATSIDAVVLRAFELLVAAHQSTRLVASVASDPRIHGSATNTFPSNL